MNFPWRCFRLSCLLLLGNAVVATASLGLSADDPIPLEDGGRGLPSVRLPALDSGADEAAQIRAAAARAKDFAAQADQSEPGSAQVGRLLNAVQISLAFELEPFCTRRILGLEPPPDTETVMAREALDRAKSWVTRAEALVREARDRGGELPDDWAELSRQTTILQAFAAAQETYLFPPDGADAARHRRQTASLLSPSLEDDDPKVAAAASLWLACVRGEEGKAGPALSTLELPLMEPAKESLPYDFFSRLIRCRLLAAHGHPGAATSLLMQLEDRSLDWFATDADRGNAERAAALVRSKVLESWHDRLLPVGFEEERRWCDDGRERIRRQLLERGEPTVLRLYPAVPLITKEPDMNPPGASKKP